MPFKIYNKSLALILALCSITLMGFGIIMNISLTQINTSDFFLQILKFDKKFILLFISILVFFSTLKINTSFWARHSFIFIILSIIGLVLCFSSIIGHSVNGSSRWITLNFIGINEKIQPSEFARISVIIFLATWFNKYKKDSHSFWKTFFVPSLLICIITGLILLETDISSSMLLCGVVFFLFIAYGIKLRILLISLILGLTLVSILVYKDDNRRERILAFLDIEKYKTKHGFQQYHSRKAIIRGGFSGEGLGNSIYKKRIYGADTDFIFSIIGNEMGVIATILLVSIYSAILFCGLYIQIISKDNYKKFLALGCTCSLTLQAIIHISVNIVIAPNTGIPLPFISYGGSNQIISCFTIALLIRIYLELSQNFDKEFSEAKILKNKLSPSNL